MSKTIRAILAGSVCLVAGAAMAHPGHDADVRSATTRPAGMALALRTWTLAIGERACVGSFAVADGTNVQIRLADDSLVTLPIDCLSDGDRAWVGARQQMIRSALTPVDVIPPAGSAAWAKPSALRLILAALAGRGVLVVEPGTTRPAISTAFEPFVKLGAVKTRWDADWLYVESDGMPDHPLMAGITSWQQQVPIPQDYSGTNAWQVPLRPVPAAKPKSADGAFLRGAIALAVNGVPIFNPLNNRGDDALKFGELDEFGGHCGRADDYHYHIAPVHLQRTVGQAAPIAYALDGYPIYGYAEPDGSAVNGLDPLNGHADANGRYHYHATKTYPYLNGGFHGEVTERDGEVVPQPRATPIRQGLPLLHGAKVTDFAETKPGSYRLTYEIGGKTGSVSYTLAADRSATFDFVDTEGRKTSETYRPGQRRDRGRGEPPRDDRPRPRADAPGGVRPAAEARGLTVTSSSVDANGRLNADCTCDGKGASPAVAWSGAPSGTKSYAITLWHSAPDTEKSYWLIYRIPANAKAIQQNGKNVGVVGLNDRRRHEYDPMCSKGPGLKTYHVTVYALSAEPVLPPEKATRADLLKAVKGITLAEGTLDFSYERGAAE